jgi:hypothetical protein
VVYIVHGGWGYTLGVIETENDGSNRNFERCLEGNNDDRDLVVVPVVDALAKEQHIPAGAGMTLARNRQQKTR